LTPQALERLLNDAIGRQQAADSLLGIADRVAAAGSSRCRWNTSMPR
jgi:hypothetical protein